MIDDCHQRKSISGLVLCVYMYIVSKLLYSCVEGRGGGP